MGMLDEAALARLQAHMRAGRRPGIQAYALLDAARDPHVRDTIRRSRRPRMSLFGDEQSREIDEVAPYLVDLAEDHAFTSELLAEAWGASWGIFLTSTLSLDDIGQHLRTLLRVQTEDRKTLLFRYYDPRVLRAYLPTCSRQELAVFFGPIARLIVEDAGGRIVRDYQRRHGELAVSWLDLAAPA